MNKIMLGLATLVSCVILLSCDNKQEPKKYQGKEVVIDARNVGQWLYFSFEQGKVVYTDQFKKIESDVEDVSLKDKLDWDIAFHFTDIRTNSGVSANGQGGAVETNLRNVTDKLTALPSADEFREDVGTIIITQLYDPVLKDEEGKPKHDIHISRDFRGVNPILTTQREIPKEGTEVNPGFIRSGKKTHIGAIDFVHGVRGGGARYDLSGKVYLIRSAKGDKYYKMKIVDHSNNRGESVVVKMLYEEHK